MKARVISLALAVSAMAIAVTVAVVMPSEARGILNSSAVGSVQDGGWYMREYNGKIGIYRSGAAEPEQVLNVYVSMLPDEDREMLAKGIYLKNRTELQERIEDYSN